MISSNADEVSLTQILWGLRPLTFAALRVYGTVQIISRLAIGRPRLHERVSSPINRSPSDRLLITAAARTSSWPRILPSPSTTPSLRSIRRRTGLGAPPPRPHPESQVGRFRTSRQAVPVPMGIRDQWHMLHTKVTAKHRHYFFWLPRNVTTCPRSAATKRSKFKSSAGCVICVFGEFVAITRQAAL